MAPVAADARPGPQRPRQILRQSWSNTPQGQVQDCAQARYELAANGTDLPSLGARLAALAGASRGLYDRPMRPAKAAGEAMTSGSGTIRALMAMRTHSPTE